MKIVVLDGYANNPGDLSWQRFEHLGAFTVYDRTPSGDFELMYRRIGDAEIVLISNTELRRSILDACPSIRYIGLLSTGYDTVDLAAAREKGICVSNIPSYGTDSVAQFTMALLLEIVNQTGHHISAVRAGRWSGQPDFCFWDTPLFELSGKTMGIIGYGRIGQRTADLAEAFGMRVLFNTPHPRPGLEGSRRRFAPLEQLYTASDVIALHCPLTPETTNLIDNRSLALMKDGVILLNTSRGKLIDPASLLRALRSGKVYAAGLDVTSSEPIAPDDPLLAEPNCFITPHIAWAARESRDRLLELAADNLEVFLAGKPIHVVS